MNADQALKRTQRRRPVLLSKQIRDSIKSIEKGIKKNIEWGETQFSLLCYEPDPIVRRHFESLGYWFYEELGPHQGGGMCLWYSIHWGPKPARVEVTGIERWFRNVFGCGTPLPWNERM